MNDYDQNTIKLLAFIYIVLAFETDKDLSDEEKGTIIKKLHDWVPNTTLLELSAILNELLKNYDRIDTRQMLVTSGDTINKFFSDEQKVTVIKDLVAIGASDGVMYQSERDFIEMIMLNWNLAEKINIDDHIPSHVTKLDKNS
ncbi:MAG: hypothetical protein KJ799_08385 [Bacteroidetes bacterium]|nr:hypothetical protein [Bacteroidota bacterium]MBU1678555.1 hypothetical protein [Bacteroidota bacterium]MBU2506728.1 hypothetical protein [Bacteroidota bacterium]